MSTPFLYRLGAHLVVGNTNKNGMLGMLLMIGIFKVSGKPISSMWYPLGCPRAQDAGSSPPGVLCF